MRRSRNPRTWQPSSSRGAAAENFIGRDTAAAIEAVHGDLPDDCDLDGDEAAFDLGKAKRLLGWEPQHSWREAEGLDVDGPDFV